jgi:hypothetical protein
MFPTRNNINDHRPQQWTKALQTNTTLSLQPMENYNPEANQRQTSGEHIGNRYVAPYSQQPLCVYIVMLRKPTQIKQLE